MSTRRKPDSEPAPKKSRKRGTWHRTLSGIRGAGRFSRKTILRVGAAVLILIVLLIIASFFVDEPMRSQMERRMNQSLKGYSVQIPKLHFSLFGGSIALRGLTIRQQANP
ncbi:MAG: hypothetical protein ABJC61_00495, partial [Acidobacteriota bacterium]